MPHIIREMQSFHESLGLIAPAQQHEELRAPSLLIMACARCCLQLLDLEHMMGDGTRRFSSSNCDHDTINQAGMFPLFLVDMLLALLNDR
jgi:hypothetical protein